ncbi:MAG TPA: hypothetical protein VFJ29_07615 [Candidatus Kapabacteria bacterium]|nr:hypothetical protein [Candidatus Kapabacteria bacterium]
MTERYDPEKLYERIVSASGGLRHAEDVHALIQAASPEHAAVIYDIAFRAKFIVRTRNVLQRLAPNDDNRAKLKETFQSELGSVKENILKLTSDLPENEQKRFEQYYFSPTVESFGMLMDLLHDLSWIQNVKIDEEEL